MNLHNLWRIGFYGTISLLHNLLQAGVSEDIIKAFTGHRREEYFVRTSTLVRFFPQIGFSERAFGRNSGYRKKIFTIC
jgi:hypothetical protein